MMMNADISAASEPYPEAPSNRANTTVITSAITLAAITAAAMPAARPVSEAPSERHSAWRSCRRFTVGEGIDWRRVGPLVRGDDGRPRCSWGASTPDYIAYHDSEWGRPVTDDRGLYERMVLEGFQSGLSWLTILRKRENFRVAFADFEIDAVARFGERDVAAPAGRRRHRPPPRQDRGGHRECRSPLGPALRTASRWPS